ncbi:MAG: hypothetical protein ACRD8W_15140 [Nitrososphaeraceae archaeon]
MIHTKIIDALQDRYLILHHEFTTGNSSITHGFMVVYDGLSWQIITNLSGEDTIVVLTGGTDGYLSFIAFNPTKQIGLVVLCSCDETDTNQLALTQTVFFHGFELSQSGFLRLHYRS